MTGTTGAGRRLGMVGAGVLLAAAWGGGAYAQVPGDLNCDGAVSPADLRPFAEAIHDPAGWCQRFACPLAELLIRADFNADGVVTPADIPGFTARLALAWPGSAGAPEMQAAGLDGATGSEGLTDPGGIDLDIDSDNTNGRGFPERSPGEDAVEAAAGARGKYLPVNSDDDDANEIPDGQQGPPAPGDDDLRPLLLELRPAETVPALQPAWDSLAWRLEYAGGDVRVRLSTSDGAPGAVLDPQAMYTQIIWVLGDLNADGAVTFDDIDPFILALACLDDAGPFVAAYWTPPPGHPGYPDFRQVGDLNGDGALNFDDIDWLVGAIGAPPRYLPVRLWAEAPPGMRTEVTALLTASGDVDGPGPRGLDVEDQVLVRRFLIDCAGAPGCDCDFRGACVNPAPGIPPFIPRGDCAQYDAHIYLAGACLVCQCEILKHGTPCLASGFIGWFLNGEEIGGGASTWERLYPGALGTPGPGTWAGSGPCQGWGTCAPSASFALVPGVLPPGEYRLVGLWECFCDGCICPGTFVQTFTVVAAGVRELESNDHVCDNCCEQPGLGWSSGVPACPAHRDVRSVLALDAGGATVLPTVQRRVRFNDKPWSDWQIWGPHQSSPNEFHTTWHCGDFALGLGRTDAVQWKVATTPPVELPVQGFATLHCQLALSGAELACQPTPIDVCALAHPWFHLRASVPAGAPGTVTLECPDDIPVSNDPDNTNPLPPGSRTWSTDAAGQFGKDIWLHLGPEAREFTVTLRLSWNGHECSDARALRVPAVEPSLTFETNPITGWSNALRINADFTEQNAGGHVEDFRNPDLIVVDDPLLLHGTLSLPATSAGRFQLDTSRDARVGVWAVMPDGSPVRADRGSWINYAGAGVVIPIRVEGLDGSQTPDDISILPIVACTQPNGAECYGVGHTKYLTVVRSDFMITFDDGPFKHAHGAPMNTPANATQTILDQLADVWVDGHPVRAAFFVVGHDGSMRTLVDPVYMREGVDGEPDFNPSNHDLAQAIAGAGHLLGNHSNTHNAFVAVLDPSVIANEIMECHRKLAEAGLGDGQRFRPPYFAAAALLMVVEQGAHDTERQLIWGSAYRDWEGLSAQEIADAIVAHMSGSWNSPGAPQSRPYPNIGVLHDCAAHVPAGTRTIVDRVRSKGFVLVDFDAALAQPNRDLYLWLP